ncbi:MAG: SGNH/GDSL hydrolase family protein [Fimbriimonadaceae bacterium]|jgi:lysophospholipase L1-like esterase|nr:SGNH/GDSL hydrolase family protein [Fimbriimonadaceae bacterium]
MRQTPLKVAFLGGSITDGYGASQKEKSSYRALVVEAVRESCPEHEVIGLNCGLGGTGSDLGLFRVRSEVIAHSPDVVVVEFAINDTDLSPRWRRLALGSLLNLLRRELPHSQVIGLVTERRDASGNSIPEVRSSQKDHLELFRHFGVPCVAGHEAIQAAVEASGLGWGVFLPDGVHPNDAGYRLYSDCLSPIVCQMVKRESQPVASATGGKWLQNPRLITPTSHPHLIKAPIESISHPLYSSAWHLSPDHPKFKLHGSLSCLGLLVWVTRRSGTLIATDRGSANSYPLWDSYSQTFERLAPRFLQKNLRAREINLCLSIQAHPEGGEEALIAGILLA